MSDFAQWQNLSEVNSARSRMRLLPSHARVDRWYHEEPEWNYLAAEIEEIARRFRSLDEGLEKLARRVGDLLPYRKGSQ